MTKEEAVKYLKTLDNDKIIEIYDEYCDDCRCTEWYVYGMSILDELLDGETAEKIESMKSQGRFNPNHAYFIYFTDEIVSFDRWDDRESPVDLDELAEYLSN